MDVIEKNAVLMVVDVQEALEASSDGKMNNPGAEGNLVRLIERWRRDDLPRFFVRYISPRPASPFHKDAPGSRFKASVKPRPGETVIEKHFESVFMKTDLEERLRKANLRTLIFTGFYSDQCIAASSKVANNLGFEVMAVSDATATIGCPGYKNEKFYEAEDIHRMMMGNLQRDGITILESAELL